MKSSEHKMDLHPTAFETKTSHRSLFLFEYHEQLRLAMMFHPEEYMTPVTEIDAVYTRMVNAFDSNSYNKDSRAIRATCRRLGIPHTYYGINVFFCT